jgi:hypothetical protein
MKTRACLCLSALILVSACSTRPRDFQARLSLTPERQDMFTRDFAVCKLMVDRGVRGQFKDQLAANSGAAAGIAAGGVAAGVAIGTQVGATVANSISAAAGQVGTASGSATASTLSVAAPVVGILVSVAISQTIKGKREKQVKSAMTNCLAESGYSVTGWTPDNRVMAMPAVLPKDNMADKPASIPGA